MQKHVYCLVLALQTFVCAAQGLYNNGAVIKIDTGALVTINGSFNNVSGASTSNLGSIIITENFTNASTIMGNGRVVFKGLSSKAYTSSQQQQLGKIYLDTLCGELTLLQHMDINDSLYIAGGSVLNFGNYNLHLSGGIYGNGTIKTNGSNNLIVNTNGDAGVLNLNQSSPSISNRLASISITNNGQLTLGKTTEVTNEVDVVSGIINSSGNLVLVSDSIKTARVTELGVGSDVTGNVTVQRYIPSVVRRSRILSSPVQNFNFSQLIDDIFLTGNGGAINGFDVSPNNSATVYTYQEDTFGGRGWKPINNINSSLATAVGGLVFIRGDRTINGWFSAPFPQQNAVLIDFVNQPINKGNISPVVTYTNTGSLTDDGWNMLGNPYPSPIDWSCIAKTNVSPFYYTYNVSTGSYVANTGSDAIACGQGFFVQAIGVNPSVNFTENCKVSATPVSYFKKSNPTITATIRKDSLNADFLKIIFTTGSSKNYVVQEDAVKFSNSLLNFASLVNNDSVQLQYHTTPPLTLAYDTIYLYTSAPIGNYTLTFDGVISIDNSYQILLIDSFTQSFIDLRTQPFYNFIVNSNTMSALSKRFKLVFIKSNPLPVLLLSFHGDRQNNDSKLFWSTSNEEKIDSYIVERQVEGGKWETVGILKAGENNDATKTYFFNDINAFNSGISKLYYRLKMLSLNGTFQYSSVISLTNSKIDIASLVSVFPNPATDLIKIDYKGEINSVEFFDLNGIQHGKQVPYGNSLSISNLEKGIYLLKINTDLGVLNAKLIKL